MGISIHQFLNLIKAEEKACHATAQAMPAARETLWRIRWVALDAEMNPLQTLWYIMITEYVIRV